MSGDPDAPHVVNLINSVVGVGILTIPFCFKECGLLLGAIVLAFAGFATFSSVALLLQAAIAKSKRNYEFLCKSCFGATGKIGVEFAQIGLMLGTCIGRLTQERKMTKKLPSLNSFRNGRSKKREAKLRVKNYS